MCIYFVLKNFDTNHNQTKQQSLHITLNREMTYEIFLLHADITNHVHHHGYRHNNKELH